MLTPSDLANDERQSGYDHVASAGGMSGRPNSNGKPWRAAAGAKKGPGTTWSGPRRATALEAAKDYCDHVNGGAVTPVPTLKSAGHKSKRPRLPDDPEVQAALGVIKDARGAQAGNQGFVYLICETDPYTGSVDLLDGYAKIGFSTNPEARVAELQTGNPRKLKLVAYFPGDEAVERDTQRSFIAYNVLQEWFRLTPALWLYFTSARKDAIIP